MRLAVLLMALAVPAVAGAGPVSFTQSHGANAIRVHGNTYTLSGLVTARNRNPHWLQRVLPRVAHQLARGVDYLRLRRGINPGRFDRFHRIAGWLLANSVEEVPPAPAPAPIAVPIAEPTPAAVPELPVTVTSILPPLPPPPVVTVPPILPVPPSVVPPPFIRPPIVSPPHHCPPRPNPVPEPATWGGLIVGLVMLGVGRYRRRLTGVDA